MVLIVYLHHCLKCCHDVWIYKCTRNHGLSIVDMVDGVVTLQEWYGTMTDNIQRID